MLTPEDDRVIARLRDTFDATASIEHVTPENTWSATATTHSTRTAPTPRWRTPRVLAVSVGVVLVAMIAALVTVIAPGSANRSNDAAGPSSVATGSAAPSAIDPAPTSSAPTTTAPTTTAPTTTGAISTSPGSTSPSSTDASSAVNPTLPTALVPCFPYRTAGDVSQYVGLTLKAAIVLSRDRGDSVIAYAQNGTCTSRFGKKWLHPVVAVALTGGADSPYVGMTISYATRVSR